MRKIVLDLAATMDNFIEGPNGEIDWCIMDDDMNFSGFLESIDTILYGRVSYDAWGNFVPGAEASEAEKALWAAIGEKKKYVFSNRGRADAHATFVNTDVPGFVMELKQQPGKDIWLYGGAKLIKTFVDLNLVDVYRISVHPTVLGKGKPLFEDVKARIDFKLMQTNVFRSGVVQLVYEPSRK